MTAVHLPALPPGIDAHALAEAVSAARSWRGVLRAFGLTSTHKARQMRAYCDAAGIDYSHFTQRTFDEARLRAAVASSRDWPELLAALGLAASSGSAKASVRTYCRELGLDLAPVECSGAAQEMSASDDRYVPKVENLRQAGAFLVAASYVLAGHRISWPLEPAAYDLLADVAGVGTQRVQVKTTTYASGASWMCSIARSVYRPGGSKAKVPYEPGDVDVFGIVDGELQVYLVPAALVTGRRVIALSRYKGFRVPRMQERLREIRPESG